MHVREGRSVALNGETDDQAIVANAHIVLTEIQEYAARNPAFAKMLRNVKMPSGETIEWFASETGWLAVKMLRNVKTPSGETIERLQHKR